MKEFDFYKLVAHMRQVQRQYDHMRISELQIAKNKLEQQVDEEIKKVIIPNKLNERKLF